MAQDIGNSVPPQDTRWREGPEYLLNYRGKWMHPLLRVVLPSCAGFLISKIPAGRL
jgi:hypothetical protein